MGTCDAAAAQAFGEFLSDGREHFRRHGLAPFFLRRLRELEAAFERQGALTFTSSSLLFVYDAATALESSSVHQPQQQQQQTTSAAAAVGSPPHARPLPPPAADLRLIDFAHVRGSSGDGGQGVDSNCLYGIRRAIAALERA